MKKFINDYWWLIAIAAFLWWRGRNKNTVKTTKEVPSKEPIYQFVGKKCQIHFSDKWAQYAGDRGAKGIQLNGKSYSSLAEGDVFTISKILETPNVTLAGNGWVSEPFTRYDVYLPDGRYFIISDKDFGKHVFFVTAEVY